MIDWSRIDVVLLDMDGTLLDLHYDNTVWNERLPRHYSAHHELSDEDAQSHLFDYMRTVYGQIEFYCLDHWSEFTGLDILEPHRDVTHLIQWRPNALEFTRRVRQSGRPAVLATNAHPDSVAIKDQHSQIVQELDGVITAHGYQAPKEQQAFWQALFEEHPYDPGRALFIDDNAAVLDAAVEFGVGQVLTITQPDSGRPPRENLAHPTLDDFSQIWPTH